MNKRRTISVALTTVVLLTLALTTGGALAQSSPAGATMPYAGRLTDSAGLPVSDGPYDFVFTLYASEIDDRVLWSETQLGVSVTGGEVQTSLGMLTPFPSTLSEKGTYWLAVSVRGPGETRYTLLNPRQLLSAIPGVLTAVTALACPHNHFTDSWPGSNGEYGLLIDNASTGDGLRAYSRSTVWNYAAVFGANTASTGYGTGVYGYSAKGVGMYANSAGGDALEAVTTANNRSAVYAHTTAAGANGVKATSGSGDGVVGQAAAGTKSGVYGVNTITTSVGYGVFGRAQSGFGLGADGKDDSYTDHVGDVFLAGNRGEILAPGTVMQMFSNGYIVFDLDDDNNGAHQLEVWNGAEVLVYKVDESGNTTATGTKSASVNTANYGDRLVYAVESPEVWFEDIGTATLKDGAITVSLEPIFAETVNLKTDYHVFLTPLGDCAVYVSQKTATGFTVKALGGATCSIAFDYRIVARRLGYEQTRLAPDSSPNSRSPEVQP